MTSLSARPRVTYLNCDQQGGMLHYVLNLSQAASNHVDVTLVDHGYRPAPACRDAAVPVLFVPRKNASGLGRRLNKYRPDLYRQLAAAIQRETRPDIVHLTMHFTGITSLAAALRERGIRVVYTLHDPEPHEENRSLWGHIYRRYEAGPQIKRLRELCSLIHVHSESQRRFLVDKWGASASRSVYAAALGASVTTEMTDGGRVPPELTPPDNPQSIKVLFFGRIQPYKGVDHLLEAFQLLQSQHVPAQLIVAGSGKINSPYRPRDAVFINRFIDDSEIKSLFDHADVVVLPYISATQTAVTPLAYRFGKPVICTTVGSLPEAVLEGVTGTLVPPHRPELLAEAIKSLGENRALLCGMGANARQFLDEKLGWDHVITTHIAHYRSLLSANSPAGAIHEVQ